MDRATLRDIIQWEVRSWSRILPLWQQHLPTERPLRALGIGEREGGLSLWAARQGIDVVCSDLRPFPNATAALHQRHGVQHRITYAQEDATRLSFPEGSFRVVYFKSVIGALTTKERQAQAIKEMHRVLEPGGVLLFAENLHGTRAHRWLRKRFVPWEHYWRYLDPHMDLDLFASFSRLDARTTGLFANLGRSEGQRDLIARLDRVLTPLVPSTMRAIWYGAAVKG
ncbi:MAG: class I SAM-dependent methyltransferase [Flavobacteriales bacterium]|nr:class I SAM-dependent methyltransferase [Flavobacteriales bacterium]